MSMDMSDDHHDGARIHHGKGHDRFVGSAETTGATVIRVPATHGTPPITRWSTEIRSNSLHSILRPQAIDETRLWSIDDGTRRTGLVAVTVGYGREAGCDESSVRSDGVRGG
jgi:hypothetical protein